ncbi:MAG: hypothetical protein KGH63_01325 [Candidatus Micrarchaeota archaeon]|nr:hypothetical protein [Candidatus Micrarchaeota archaeon]
MKIFEGRTTEKENESDTSETWKGGLDFQVTYENGGGVLWMDVIKNEETGGYQSARRYPAWNFELIGGLPKGQGIGSGLWKALETIFQEYNVTCIRGIVSNYPTFEKRDPTVLEKELQQKARFWKKMGFTILPDYRMYKDYPGKTG